MSTKKVLIIGVDSVIGGSLGDYLSRLNYKVFGTSRRKNTKHIYLDIASNPNNWPKLEKFNVIVVCASINTLQECQEDQKISYKVNVQGLQNIIDKYLELHTQLIFFSSTHVFSGKKNIYYDYNTPDPINELGGQKYIAEEMVRNSGGLVIRMTKVIDCDFPRFTNWMFNLKSSNNIYAYDNLYTSIIPLSIVLEVVHMLIQLNWRNTIHISGPDEKSYFDIAIYLAKFFNFNKNLVVPTKIEINKQHEKSHNRIIFKTSEVVSQLSLNFPNTEMIIKGWCDSHTFKK